MSKLDARLRALEQRHSPDLFAMYAAARERLEAKLLAMSEPAEPLALSAVEIEELIADTKAYLREQKDWREHHGR